jgi:hypothetical protein
MTRIHKKVLSLSPYKEDNYRMMGLWNKYL